MFILVLKRGKVDGQWDGKGMEMTVLGTIFLVSAGSSSREGVTGLVSGEQINPVTKVYFYSISTHEIESTKIS